MQGLEAIGVGDTVYVDEFGAIKTFRIDRVTPTQVCSGFTRFRKKDGLQIGTGSDSWAGTYATKINEKIRSQLKIQKVQKMLWNSVRDLEALSKTVNDENCKQIEEIANTIGCALGKGAGDEEKRCYVCIQLMDEGEGLIYDNHFMHYRCVDRYKRGYRRDRTELKLPDGGVFFIFDGIEEPFEEYWLTREKDHSEGEREEAKQKAWNNLVSFIMKWTKNYQDIVPKRITKCLIETKQNYADFGAEDIIHTIASLGKIANFMYGVDRYVLESNYVLEPEIYYPLRKYYTSALGQIVWMVATFTQDGTSGFVDLETKLREIIDIEERERKGMETET